MWGWECPPDADDGLFEEVARRDEVAALDRDVRFVQGREELLDDEGFAGAFDAVQDQGLRCPFFGLGSC